MDSDALSGLAGKMPGQQGPAAPKGQMPGAAGPPGGAYQWIKNKIGDIFFDSKIDPLELEFMSEADAAIYRRGKPRAYIVSLMLVAFFAAMLVWAANTRLDEVTKAHGQVVPSQAIQEVQYMEGGVLESLLVRQGDEVTPGQVVARISNVFAESSLQEQKGGQAALEAEVIRLRAERDGKEPVFYDEMMRDYPNIARGQMELYYTRQDQLRTELRTLEAEREQRRREVQEAEARMQSIRGNLALATQRREMAKPLLARGSYSRMDYMNLEQSVVSLEGDLATTTQSISRARSGVTAADEKLRSRTLEWQRTVQEELNQKTTALNSVSTLLTARGDTVKRTDLRAPVRGKIKRVMVNTVGGTVAPGATIMEILPIDDQLLIEGRVSPADRAFLHTADDPEKQQRAIVKISTYDFAIYGGMEANLESISDDTFEDNRGDIYYQVRVLTMENALYHNGQAYEILPGMTAQVDIITGKKTVLSYLLKPIFKAQQNALRER
jgi:adhesin transport system membrane fusion protein